METGGEEKEGDKLYTWETKYEKTWYEAETELCMPKIAISFSAVYNKKTKTCFLSTHQT